MKHTARPNARDGAYALVLLLVGLAWCGLRLDTSIPPSEDAAILMRYSENLAQGHGVVWNVGEGPVDGATDFLFMVVLAGVRWLGFTIETSTRLIGIASHLLTCLVLYFGVRRLHDAPRWAALLSAGYLLLGPGLAYVEAGFGTPFFGLFAATTWFLAYRIYQGDQRPRTAVLLALSGLALGLVRPEGVFLALFCLLALVLFRGWSASRRAVATFVVVFGVPGLAYFLWRWSYFGHPLPNPYYIKGRGHVYLRHLVNGCLDVVRLAGPFVPLYLYAVAAAAVKLATGRRGDASGADAPGSPREVGFVLFPVLGFTAIGMLHEGLMDYVMRFQYCLLPLLLLSWPALLAGALRDWNLPGALDPTRRRLGAAAVGVVSLVALGYAWSSFQVPTTRRWGTLDVARILSRYSHDYTIAVTNAGQLPLYSGWKAIDVWGLNDHGIATKGLTEEFLDRYRPEVIQFDANFSPLVEPPAGGLPWHDAMKLLQAYARENDYVLAACFGRGPYKCHYYYVRRDFPESAEIVSRIRGMDYFLVSGRCFDFGIFDPSRGDG